MKTLLIAEHNEILISELSKALSARWEIYTCRSGSTIPDLLKELQPDAMILDLSLPPNGGIEVLAAAFPDLPPAIIALSAIVNSHVEHCAARWGVDYLFEIPFDIKQLKSALDDAVLQRIPAKQGAQHLRILRYRSGLDGYMCLLASLPVIIEDPARKFGKEVFTIVAELCGMTDHRDVDHAIRTATNDAWERRDIEVWSKYFPLNKDGDIDRPKTRDIIRCLLKKIT